jgi:single-strand DNA-binding protein
MSNLNEWRGIGRLTADIEQRYLPNGNAVANFTIAVDDSYKKKDSNEKVEQTEWVRCTAFGKTAEFLANWLHKGKRVLVCGKMKTREYEKDGIKRYVTEIHVGQGAEIIDWPEKDAQRQSQPQPQSRPQPSQQATPPDSFDDDIPFIDAYRGARSLLI